MIMNVKNKNMTWKHVYENMNTWLDVRLWLCCSNIIKKRTFQKRIAAWAVCVTNPASVVPPDRHQKSPSPEYWLLSLNSISHHPVPGLWLLVHPMLIYGTHTHRKVLYCPGWHFWACSSFSVWSLYFDSGLFLLLSIDICLPFDPLACLDTLLLFLLWYPCYRYRPLPVQLC